MANRDEDERIPGAEKALQLLREVRDFQKETGADCLLDTAAEKSTTETEFQTTHLLEESLELDELPKSIGRFKIIRQLGSGGFARVFLAKDPKLNREVAVKIPNLNFMLSGESRLRFEREAQSAGVLSHPGIVPVFEHGNLGPIAFITYEYCPGDTLSDWLVGKKLSLQEAAKITLTLAEAIEHAHQRGVIHRDLKPANILIQTFDDQSTRIRITDFGLAKHLNSENQTLTKDGAIIGTPAYMSPEQASGETLVGTKSDIFSLGVIFYELLTGESPFSKSSHIETIQAIQLAEPKLPSKIRNEIPADLDAVSFKCLEKNPAKRYSSAFELAEDLDSWLSGRGVGARRPGSFERFVRWCERNRTVAASCTLAFFSLAIGLVFSIWQWQNAVTSEQVAQIEKRKAVIARNAAISAQNAAEKAAEVAVREKKIAESANMDSETLADFLVLGIVSAAQPKGIQKGQGKDVTVAKMLSNLELEIDESLGDRPVVEARARNAFGSIWQQLGNYEKAGKHFNRVLTLKDELGQLDEQTFLAALQVGNLLFRNGKFNEARALFHDNINRVIATMGKDHRLTLIYRNSLAAVSLRLKNYSDAVREFESLAEAYERLHGISNISTQTTTRNLAVAHREAGNFTDSILILKQLFKQQHDQFGIENYQTLATMADLAESQNRGGEFESAAKLLENALPVAIEKLGEKNPKTMEIRFYRARNLMMSGHGKEAIEFCLETKQVCEKQFGEYHSITNQANMLLAQIYLENGQFNEVETVIGELVKQHQQQNNLEKELMDGTMLARAYLRQGKLEQLERYVLKQRQRAAEILAEDNAFAELYDFFLARGYESRMDWPKATSLYRDLVQKSNSKGVGNASHQLSYSKMLSGFANSLNEQRDYKKAKPIAEEAKQIRVEINAANYFVAEANSICDSIDFALTNDEKLLDELEQSHQQIERYFEDAQDFQSAMLMRDSCRRLIRAYESQSIRQLDRSAELRAVVAKIKHDYLF